MICTRTTKAVVAGTPANLLAKTLLPAIASSSRTRSIHSSTPHHAAASAASTAETSDNNNTNSNIPDDIDTPLPKGINQSKKPTEAAYFNDQKRRLLTSMDMLYQIQDAPSEKLDATSLDDQEAEYWARRMDTAMTDLELERTRLRVTGMRVSLFSYLSSSAQCLSF